MTRASATVILVFAAFSALASEARIPAQPAYVIPFDFTENTVWLNVKVNGKGPFTFMLDTAAANFAIDWSEAQRTGLDVTEVIQNGPAGSGDGTARVGIVRDATVEVGPVRLDLPHIGAISLAPPRQSWDRKFDGVVGTPLFEKYTVAVDYAARELRLYDPESYEYTGTGYVLPVRLAAKAPYVKASFMFPRRPQAQGDFLVDSGMRTVALFSSPYSTDRALEGAMRTAGRRLISVPTLGAQGESGRWIGRIESFSAGPFTLKRPVVGLSTAKGGFFAQPGPAGAIGTEVLRRFTVIFDYERGRLILEPNSALADVASEDASGIALRKEGDPPRVEVWKVAPDSPASEAGIQPGDRIIAIGETQAPPLSAARQALMAERATVALTLERAGNRVNLALKLRRLL